jgi:hypothetical protein
MARAAALAYAAAAYAWLRLGVPYPLHYVEAMEVLLMLDQWTLLAERGLGGALWGLYMESDQGLYGFAAAFAIRLFGRALAVPVLSLNIPLYALAVVSIYRIGKLLDRPSAGFAAAAAFSLFPAVYGTARLFAPEFAVMCVAAFVVWRFLETGDFQRRRASVLFGVALGAGLLVKYTFVSVVAAPLAAGTALAFRQGRRGARQKLVNLLLAVGAALLIAGPKHLQPRLLAQYRVRPSWEPSPIPWHSLENLRVTVLGIVEQHLSLPFFVALLAAGWLCRTAASPKAKLLLAAWIFAPWALFVTMKRAPEPHYMTCYLPPIALTIGLGWRALAARSPGAARWAAAALALVGAVQFHEFSFRPALGLGQVRWLKFGPLQARWYRPRPSVCGFPRRDRDYERVFEHLAARHPAARSVVFVEGGPSSRDSLNSNALRTAAWQKRVPYRLTTIAPMGGWIFHDGWKNADTLVTAWSDKAALTEHLEAGDRLFEEFERQYPGYAQVRKPPAPSLREALRRRAAGQGPRRPGPQLQDCRRTEEARRPLRLKRAIRREIGRYELAGAIDLENRDDLHVFTARADGN